MRLRVDLRTPARRRRWRFFSTFELCAVHHALRMLAKHEPGQGHEQLAQEAWDEHCRREPIA